MPGQRNWDWNALGTKWAQQMGSPTSQANYKAGYARLTVSPTQLAAAPEAQNRYAQATAAAVSSGKMARKLQEVSLADMQNAVNLKGAPNLGRGATLAVPKWVKAMQPFGAVYNQIDSTLANMPKGGVTKEERKANAMARAAVAIAALIDAGSKS